MTQQIEVLESLMGNGKTYATLRYIEQQVLDNPSNHWIYCTEYLDEIQTRITDEKSLCKHLWRTPLDTDKTEKLIELLLEPKVQLIAITHALLLIASRNTYINSLFKAKGYNLFLDETIELITPYNKVKYGDFLVWHSENWFSMVDPLGKVVWTYNDKTSNGLSTSFDQLALDSKKGTVYAHIRGSSVGIVNIEDEVIFSQFNRVILATYQLEYSLFDAYLRIKNIKKVPSDIVCDKNNTKENIRSLITHYSKHYDKFKEMKLSSTWWNSTTKGNATVEDIKLISKTIRNTGDVLGCKGKPELLGFTVPAERIGSKTAPRIIHARGYPAEVCFLEESSELDKTGKPKLVQTNIKDKPRSTYIPCNARASEDYKNKVVMIHAYNRFPLVSISDYLTAKNIPYSAEVFALNELLQWLWRSAIRDNKPITVSILSDRMRNLFDEWLSK